MKPRKKIFTTRSFCVVWHKGAIDNKTKLLDISDAIIYTPEKFKDFLAFPDDKMDLVEDFYENQVSFEAFSELWQSGFRILGEIINDEPKISLRVDKCEANASALNKMNLLKKTEALLLPRISEEEIRKIRQLPQGDSFLQISVCKECGLAEDESRYAWVYRNDEHLSVPVIIHNDGNMWLSRTVE